jgi:hypothetical protein
MVFGALFDRFIGVKDTAFMPVNMWIGFAFESQRQWAIAANYKQLQFLSNLQAITGQNGFRPSIIQGLSSQYLNWYSNIGRWSPMFVLFLSILIGFFWGFAVVSRFVMGLLLALNIFFITFGVLVFWFGGTTGTAVFTTRVPLVFSIGFGSLVGFPVGFLLYNP